MDAAVTAGRPEDRAETARWEAEILRRAEAVERRLPPDPPARYLYRPSRDEKRHVCPLPAEWELGAVWRCPEGHLWVVDHECECRGRIERHGGRGAHMVGLAWWPATFWQRRRWGGITIGAARRTRLDLANGNRSQSFAGMALPPPAPLTPPTDFDG